MLPLPHFLLQEMILSRVPTVGRKCVCVCHAMMTVMNDD